MIRLELMNGGAVGQVNLSKVTAENDFLPPNCLGSNQMNRTLKFVKGMFSLCIGVILVGSSLERAIGLEYVPQSQKEEHFNRKVLPLLKKRCYSCHSHDSGKAKGGLVLDSRQGWQKGGGLGSAIVPGAPDDSLLIQAVRHDGLEMPPDNKLSAKEISILEISFADNLLSGGISSPS